MKLQRASAVSIPNNFGVCYMAVSLKRPKFVSKREIFDENMVISWIGLSVVAGSFQLND